MKLPVLTSPAPWLALVLLIGVTGRPTLLAAQPELALPMKPVPNGTFALDQDTPDDSMAVWKLDPMIGINAMRTKLTVHRTGKRGRNPTFAFALSNAEDTVRFQVFSKPAGRTLVPLLTEDKDHTESKNLIGGVYAFELAVGETVDVEVNWTDLGEVKVTLRGKDPSSLKGFQRNSVTMRGGAPTALQFFAISGEAEWNPIQLGSTTVKAN